MAPAVLALPMWVWGPELEGAGDTGGAGGVAIGGSLFTAAELIPALQMGHVLPYIAVSNTCPSGPRHFTFAMILVFSFVD